MEYGIPGKIELFLIGGKEMIRKITLFTFILSLLAFNSFYVADAFFFKKHKATKKEEAIKEEEKKKEAQVLVVQIFASWCPGCKNIQPTLDQLVNEVEDINFVQLDVSTPSKSQTSSKRAKELKINDFYSANKSKTSTVAVIVPGTGEIISIFENNNNLEEYTEAIEKAKTKQKTLENPPA